MRIPASQPLEKYGIELLDNLKTEASIYFHWPFCKNICTFCNFNKYKKSESRFGLDFDNQMTASLLKETETVLSLTGVKRIKSIYFGGGTPSLAPTKTISKLINHVKQLTEVDEEAEVTIEVNPSSLDITTALEEYIQYGVTRVSIGVQSLHDETLKILGRDHSASDGLKLLQQATDIFGSHSVSVDLLFRKPGDSIQSWEEELGKILDNKPFHLSLYELTPERGTPLFKQLKTGAVILPNENDTASMYLASLKLLRHANLERYEVSNFAKSRTTRSLHNMAYWDGTQYIGIGPGAHSRFFTLESTTRESRVQCLDPKLWQKMVERNGHGTQIRRSQSQFEVLSELLATSLRTTKGIHPNRWQVFQAKYSLDDVFKESQLIQTLCRNGNLQWGGDGNLHATDQGLNVVDAILPNILKVLIEFYEMNKLTV